MNRYLLTLLPTVLLAVVGCKQAATEIEARVTETGLICVLILIGICSAGCRCVRYSGEAAEVGVVPYFF